MCPQGNHSRSGSRSSTACCRSIDPARTGSTYLCRWIRARFAPSWGTESCCSCCRSSRWGSQCQLSAHLHHNTGPGRTPHTRHCWSRRTRRTCTCEGTLSVTGCNHDQVVMWRSLCQHLERFHRSICRAHIGHSSIITSLLGRNLAGTQLPPGNRLQCNDQVWQDH